MKIRCLNCEHGYTPLYGYGCGEEVQSCDYGLRDGAMAPPLSGSTAEWTGKNFVK